MDIVDRMGIVNILASFAGAHVPELYMGTFK